MPFYSRIRSRHPSHEILRRNRNLRFKYRSVVRMGSTTSIDDIFADKVGGRSFKFVEINNVEGVKVSSNKLESKLRFGNANVPTPEFFIISSVFPTPTITAYDRDDDNRIVTVNNMSLNSIIYPIIAKKQNGSRGEGMKLFRNYEELSESFEELLHSNYIFEKYYNYNREYRLHVTEDGCFYTCRKMLRNDVPEENRWYRNDNNCVWIREDNDSFDKPGNWDEIEASCVSALKSVGLDFAAFDVRVQSSRNGERTDPKYMILESNSAPSFGEITTEKYIDMLNGLINKKIEEENFKTL